MKVKRKCTTRCLRTFEIEVPEEGYEKWKRGEGYIQDLMPQVSIGDRELLMSGTCSECFDELFPPEEFEHHHHGDGI